MIIQRECKMTKKTQIKKSNQNRMHYYYVLYTVCHMTMQGLFSNSAKNCSQNGIWHHYIPYMVGHMTMQGWFPNLGENCGQNGI